MMLQVEAGDRRFTRLDYFFSAGHLPANYSQVSAQAEKSCLCVVLHAAKMLLHLASSILDCCLARRLWVVGLLEDLTLGVLPAFCETAKV